MRAHREGAIAAAERERDMGEVMEIKAALCESQRAFERDGIAARRKSCGGTHDVADVADGAIHGSCAAVTDRYIIFYQLLDASWCLPPVSGRGPAINLATRNALNNTAVAAAAADVQHHSGWNHTSTKSSVHVVDWLTYGTGGRTITWQIPHPTWLG
eukprot:gene29697-5130_t